MTKVKICGLMEKEHVLAAVDAGVDAIGFVFAPSKRQITVERARELARDIPPHVLKVGVFVDPTRAEIETAFHEVPLDLIQLHGDESPEFIEDNSFPFIKGVSVSRREDVEQAKLYKVAYYLFDSPGREFKGGSGETFDWRMVSDIGIPPERLILAGGLHAGNVLEAIRRVKPYMVDVSSGVESQGRKDEQLIRAFLTVAKAEQRRDD